MNWKEIARQYNLDASANFWARSEAEIKQTYNGIGPDNFFPEKLSAILVESLGQQAVDKLNALLREELTKILGLFQVCGVIHDDRFADSDKTEAGFSVANEELLSNCKKVAAATYPIWNPMLWGKRLKATAAAETMFYACKKFGWDAWTN